MNHEQRPLAFAQAHTVFLGTIGAANLLLQGSRFPLGGRGGSASSFPDGLLSPERGLFGPPKCTGIIAGTQIWVSSLPLPTCTMPLCRFVIQLLEDLVFFVSDVPNNGQNVLDIVVTKPNRERQKLMREQNILKQVSGPETASEQGRGLVEMSCSGQGHAGGEGSGKPHGGGVAGLQLMAQWCAKPSWPILLVSGHVWG